MKTPLLIAAVIGLLAVMACAGESETPAGTAPPPPAPAVQPSPAAPAMEASPSAEMSDSAGEMAKPEPARPGSFRGTMDCRYGAPVAECGEPKYGGILRVAHRGDPPAGWDNMRVSNLNNSLAGQPIFGEDNLLHNCWDESARMCPGVAESWESNADFSVWTFKIRDGVKWHDGTPFTADDVTFWMNLFVNGATVGDKTRLPGATKSWLGKLQMAETLEGNRVQATLEESDPLFATRMALHHAIYFAHPKHLIEPEIQAGNTEVAPVDVGLVGTGPFAYSSHERGVVIEVRRFDEYWKVDERGNQLPYLDGVDIFITGRDSAAVQAAMRTGRLDTGGRGRGVYVGPDMIPSYEESLGDSFWLQEIPGGIGEDLGFNTLRPPFDDVRVRRAVHLWVDRYSAIESLGQGFGVPQCLMNDTAWCNEDYLTWPGYNRETKEADRAEAKRLLAEAGYPEGLKFTITGPRNRSVGLEWWSGALAGSGFEVEFEFLEVAASDDRRARSEYTASYGGGGSIDPESGLRGLSTKDVSPQAGPVHNDPKVAEFFKRMGAESEFEARREIFREFERYMLVEQVYLVRSFVGVDFIIYRDYVKGQPHHVLNGDFNSWAPVWLDQ